MNAQIIQTLLRIMQAINTNMPTLVLFANPEQKQSLLDNQQAATDNFEAGRVLAYDAEDMAVRMAAQELQKAQAAVDKSLQDLHDIATILDSLTSAVNAGVQIVALGASIL
ncbi:MAG: hypothetical protein JWL77_5810 [Chthonomonadaceae bacterium]|nr:hypothetical protein [Chthonomonadaceae bacterium]